MAVTPIPIAASSEFLLQYPIHLLNALGDGFTVSGLPDHYHVVPNSSLSLYGSVSSASGSDFSSYLRLLPSGVSIYISGTVEGSRVDASQARGTRIALTIVSDRPTAASGGFTFEIGDLSSQGQKPAGWLVRQIQGGLVQTSFVEQKSFPVYGVDSGSADAFVLLPLSKDIGGTVTFDPNGYTGIVIDPPTKEVWKGEAFGELPTPTYSLEGLKFLGWFTEPEGGSEVTADTIVTQDTDFTLYAHWEYAGYQKHLVVLDATGGTSSAGTIEVEVGGTYADLPTPTKAGYTFVGWFTEPEGGGQQITNSSVVADPPPEVLYANWTVTPTPQGDGHLLYDDSTGKLIYDDYPVVEAHG